MRHTQGRAQEFHKQAIDPNIAAVFVANQISVGLNQAFALGANRVTLRVLSEDDKSFHNREWLAQKNARITGLQTTIAKFKTAIYGHHLIFIMGMKDGLIKQLQKGLVKLGNMHRCAVITVHKLFNSQFLVIVLIAKKSSELALVVKQ